MVNLIHWCVYSLMQDTLGGNFVECISPNFIFIWITGLCNIVESILLLDSSAYQVSDLGQVVRLLFNFNSQWTRLIRCSFWDLVLPRSPDCLPLWTVNWDNATKCQSLFYCFDGGGWRVVGNLPHNEDFRHLLIKLSCLLGINSPTVLAGKARSLLLLMKSIRKW